jgi:uncharacterized protein YqgC (DUF456 family)
MIISGADDCRHMNPWLYYTLALLLVMAGAACWLSNLFSLPGNWGLLVLAGLFAWLIPAAGSRGISVTTLTILLGLAVLGEIVEFAAGAAGAAKQGASRRSIALSLVGAIVGSVGGAVLGLPIPVVGSLLTALFGGAAGAAVGAYWGEASSRRGQGQSMAVGKAAFIGRLWGTVGKFAVGAVMLGVAAVDALFV